MKIIIKKLINIPFFISVYLLYFLMSLLFNFTRRSKNIPLKNLLSIDLKSILTNILLLHSIEGRKPIPNIPQPPPSLKSPVPRGGIGARRGEEWRRSSVLVRPPSEQEPICVMSWSFEDSHSSKGFSSAWEISNSYKDEFEKMVACLFPSSLFKR